MKKLEGRRCTNLCPQQSVVPQWHMSVSNRGSPQSVNRPKNRQMSLTEKYTKINRQICVCIYLTSICCHP